MASSGKRRGGDPEDDVDLERHLSQLKAQIQQPQTDWNRLYLRVATANIQDPKYHAENFGRLPLSHLSRTLDYIETRQQMECNLNSLSTARLASVVTAALSGRNARKVTATDFLPYDPDAIDRDKRQSGLSAEGKKTLKMLLKTKRLPVSLFGLVMEDLRG